ncbi:hypothetical protein [Cerasicoccus maritimus]|uniref:hypothetical protein n=1 Tax=Cerasicoccus maritimus TaxID=490089 RepID=UPI0028528A56|nr:hypothetical protein [Cerasicoccus maritimus]
MDKSHNPKDRGPKTNGFALVVAISLMAFILLLLISLSSLLQVEIKVSATQAQLQAARQNALFGLSVAMGELQRTLGPDQRISTTASILEGAENDLSLGANLANPHLVGVWETSQWSPGNAINYTTQKQDNFVQWLVSYPSEDADELEALSFAANTIPGSLVTLVSEGSLGETAVNTASNLIQAPIVPIDESGNEQYAWAILDEGVKANVSLPSQVDSASWGSEEAQWLGLYGAPTASGIPSLADLTALAPTFAANHQINILSHDSGAVALGNVGGDPAEYKALFHDLTNYSVGVLSDPVNGGLKQDLSLLSEYNDLSDSDFSPRYLYSSGSTASYESEPAWTQVLDYLASYRSTNLTLDGDDIPRLISSTEDWSLDTDDMLAPRTSHAPTPAITRIQIVFSLVALRVPSNRVSTIQTITANTYQNCQMLYLIASPVVTIYNPYNVPLTTESLYLSLSGVPVGFLFKRESQGENGGLVSLTNQLVPLDAMITSPNNEPRIKTYGVEYVISISASDDSSDDFTLAPGESVVISPFADESSTTLASLSNWTGDRQSDANVMQGKSGYIDGAGLIYDYLNPLRTNPRANYDYTNETGSLTLVNGETILENALPNIGTTSYDSILIKDSDYMTVDIDFAVPHQPESVSEKPFKIELFDKHPFAVSGATVNRLGSYSFVYDDIDDLRDAAENFTTDTFPITKDLIPESNLFLYSSSLHSTAVQDIAPTPLAVLDVFAQTTLSNTNPSLPWSFSNPTTLAGINQLDAASTFNQSYQVTLRDANTPSVEIDSENHGFSFTGITSSEGTKFATHFEQPLQPLQSIASLQHANLASSSYLPKVDYVVGNSFANPLVPLGSVSYNSSSLGYDLLDHSYLANNFLWDSYYLSTIATYQSVFNSNGPTLSETLDNYLSGAPLQNANLQLNTQKSSTDVIRNTILVDDTTLQPDAYRKVAAFQYQTGAFNINSTSISAWKAILTSAAQQAVSAPPLISKVNDGDYDISQISANGNTFSRFRATNHDASFDEDESNNTATTTRSSPAAHAAWQGYRELTDLQISTLAASIVDEVKHRGPFLSLSEFVNRRLGSSSNDERNMMGAIDAAIATTDINDQVKDDMGLDVDIGSLGLPNSAYEDENSAMGIAGFLTQADILQQIGPKLAVRSDTFRIRAYGETSNPITGDTFKAYCEAIVQRTPQYVDSSLEPWETSATDEMGRRFEIISLRWLTDDEI